MSVLEICARLWLSHGRIGLAPWLAYDSLDTITLYIQETKQDLQEAPETIPWTEEQLLRGSPVCE